MSNTLCPFSKPIIGDFCRCRYAGVADRCSGKMFCSQTAEQRQDCVELVELLKENSRFVLGLGEERVELTHAQSMKTRCGGLLGMQRVLGLNTESPPDILDVISSTKAKYGDMKKFPFSEIIRDIKVFSHRKKYSDYRNQ